MIKSRVAFRYAKAMMDIAREEKNFEAVEEDFRTLRYAIDNSNDLRNLLATPIIDVRVKERLLMEIFKGKLSPITERFVALLARKGRSADLLGTVQAFEDQLDAERNLMPAKITVAVDLDSEQRARIESRLERMSGKKVRAEYVVDPSIIGGFRALFEDRMIDASVRHQLDRLRESLVEGSINN